MLRELSLWGTGHMHFKTTSSIASVQEVVWGSQAWVQITTLLFVGFWTEMNSWATLTSQSVTWKMEIITRGTISLGWGFRRQVCGMPYTHWPRALGECWRESRWWCAQCHVEVVGGKWCRSWKEVMVTVGWADGWGPAEEAGCELSLERRVDLRLGGGKASW